MARGFLNKADLKIIKKHFNHLLSSAEASPVTINYLESHTGTWDADRGAYDGGAETWSFITTTAILRIITIHDKRILELGVLSVGDIVFQVSKNLDIAALLDTNLKRWRITYRGVDWYPVNMNVNLPDNVAVPLGDDQVCQPIACTKTEKAEAEQGDNDW